MGARDKAGTDRKGPGAVGGLVEWSSESMH